MDKEKEIEEMEEVALRSGHSNDGYLEFDYRDIAECFYETGYRKADEVKKETAREILEYLRAVQEKDELKNCDLDWIAMQYGVEVEE